MKRALLVLSFLCLPLILKSADAPAYTLNWFTFDAGGGVSGTGQYIVNGTMSPTTPAKLEGGGFSMSGGISAVVAVIQTTNAPFLSLSREGAAVVVTWTNSPGWILETTPSLSLQWSRSELPLQTNETVVRVGEPFPTGNRFYRLRKL